MDALVRGFSTHAQSLISAGSGAWAGIVCAAPDRSSWLGITCSRGHVTVLNLGNQSLAGALAHLMWKSQLALRHRQRPLDKSLWMFSALCRQVSCKKTHETSDL